MKSPPGGCVYNPNQGISHCVEKDGSGVYSVYGDCGNAAPMARPPDLFVRWGDEICKMLYDDDYDGEMEMGM